VRSLEKRTIFNVSSEELSDLMHKSDAAVRLGDSRTQWLSRELLIRDEPPALRHEQVDRDAVGDVWVGEGDSGHCGSVETASD
jgi:hypothetical protein